MVKYTGITKLWKCHICTFANEENNTKCDMCETPKKEVPKPVPKKDTSEIDNMKLVVKKFVHKSFSKVVSKKKWIKIL